MDLTGRMQSRFPVLGAEPLLDRISRNEQMEEVMSGGFYPCGEGAGYAGGITSAAMDGLQVAEAVCKNIAYKSES